MFRPAFIIFIFCSLQASGQQHLFTGILLDKNTAEAVSNADIKYYSDTTESDKDGQFTLHTNFKNGYLNITHEGYHSMAVPPPTDSSFTTLLASPIIRINQHSDTDSSQELQQDSSSMKNLNDLITTYKAETYKKEKENPFINTKEYPYTTIPFSSGHAAYNNIRRFLSQKEKAPPSSVRIEEMLNYFPFNDKIPVQYPNQTLQTLVDFSHCPWNKSHLLMRIVVQSKERQEKRDKPWNIVLLIDVSGSMYYADKLPLLKLAFKCLVNHLEPRDTLSIVTYAGKAKIALPPTSGREKEKILKSIDHLNAGGTTAGGNGIEMAYKLAKTHFIPEGNNRIILATDGDFNVGKSTDQEMKKLISQYNGENINLTCIGVGSGNYKDSKLETLAKWGQGTFIYIDTETEALRIFNDEEFPKMQIAARKIRLKAIFNPFFISDFRLIGFDSNGENAKYAFDKNKRHMGAVMGADQRMTAYFEIAPVKKTVPDDLHPITLALQYESNAENYLQWHTPRMDVVPFKDKNVSWRFGASVTLFGMLLQESEYTNKGDYRMAKKIAKSAKDAVPREMYKNYCQLLRQARKNK